VSVVGNSITATNGIQFAGTGFRQTPVCALNRLGAGVTTPLVGLQLLPQKTMVVGGAASHGGSTPGSGVGRFLIGHGSPEGQVVGNAGDIYQRLDPEAGLRLFVKESENSPPPAGSRNRTLLAPPSEEQARSTWPSALSRR